MRGDENQLVLFICTGNYYRSRYAEAVFNHLAERRQIPWQAVSRGLAIHAVDGDISPHTETAMAREGISRGMTGATRTPLTTGDLERAHRTIALKETEHRPMMEILFPEWSHRIEYWQVDDLDAAGPDTALPCIRREVTGLVEALAATAPMLRPVGE